MTIPLGQASPQDYDSLFHKKAQLTKEEFSEFNPPELDVFPSPPSHYRMRAEFKVWHEQGTAYYAMYKPGEYKKPVKIDSYTIGSQLICSLMPTLLTELNACEVLKRRLFQVEFLTATTGEAITTLIYHRPLDDEWQQSAKALSHILGCKIIGRSRGQKIALSEDFIVERFQVADKEYHYQQVETGFTQPNAAVCQSMLNWAIQSASDIGGDLLELYCGNGNFTLPLAQKFDRVLATEVAKTSVHSAQYNIKLNNVDNIAIARMSSEEFTQALNGERAFRRLRDIDLDSYNFSTVFVDPPRSGLDKDTEKMVARFDHILYISCNPVTLKENLKALCETHIIEKFAFFDQFPYTEHRECGVLLRRKGQ
ncbi:MAG: tRNA (uridine(54)-C5)-methyltransferase TrmA [Agarilytica sp.]